MEKIILLKYSWSWESPLYRLNLSLTHRRTKMFSAKMAASTMCLVVLVVLVSVGEFQPEHL